MKIEEWKQNASPEAVEQYDQPIEWFKENVKCCYNCKNWEVDPTLKCEYMYNTCKKIERDKVFRMVAYDAHCSRYDGHCTVENLLDYAEVKDEWFG